MNDTNNSPLGCCVVVQNQKGEILLGKRKNGYKSGTYGIPGGRFEKKEKALACAKRELFEETNLTATQLKYLGVVKEWQGSHDFVHFVWPFSCN